MQVNTYFGITLRLQNTDKAVYKKGVLHTQFLFYIPCTSTTMPSWEVADCGWPPSAAPGVTRVKEIDREPPKLTALYTN